MDTSFNGVPRAGQYREEKSALLKSGQGRAQPPLAFFAPWPNTNIRAMKGKIVISQLYQGVEANKKGRSRTIAGRPPALTT
jgi:hypothetical protein